MLYIVDHLCLTCQLYGEVMYVNFFESNVDDYNQCAVIVFHEFRTLKAFTEHPPSFCGVQSFSRIDNVMNFVPKYVSMSTTKILTNNIPQFVYISDKFFIGNISMNCSEG